MSLHSFAQCSLLSMCSVPGTVLGPRGRAMCLSHFVPYRGPQPALHIFFLLLSGQCYNGEMGLLFILGCQLREQKPNTRV